VVTMERTIFYSWQNDLPNKSNRYFIKKALENAIKQLNQNNDGIPFTYDETTQGEPGSPEIFETIRAKISECEVFVCDLSIVSIYGEEHKATSNPNVLIEFGYALAELDWDNIIILHNIESGRIKDLPFDIPEKRVVGYSNLIENAQKVLVGRLRDGIASITGTNSASNWIDVSFKYDDETSISNPVHIDRLLSIQEHDFCNNVSSAALEIDYDGLNSPTRLLRETADARSKPWKHFLYNLVQEYHKILQEKQSVIVRNPRQGFCEQLERKLLKKNVIKIVLSAKNIQNRKSLEGLQVQISFAANSHYRAYKRTINFPADKDFDELRKDSGGQYFIDEVLGNVHAGQKVVTNTELIMDIEKPVKINFVIVIYAKDKKPVQYNIDLDFSVNSRVILADEVPALAT